MKRTIWILFAAACLTMSLQSCQKGYDAFAHPPVNYEFNKGLISNIDSVLEATYLVKASKDPLLSFRSWEGIPTIAADSLGKNIFIAWYSGGKGEGSGNYITTSVSSTGGRSWSNDELVIYPKKASLRFFDPCLWRDNANNIWLFFTKSNTYWDGIAGVWATKLTRKKDTILNTPARRLFDGVMMNKPVYLSSLNDILYPVSLWNTPPTPPSKTGTFIYKSDVTANTPQFNSMIMYSSLKVPDNIRTFDEHQLVETNIPGHVLCFVRTKVGIYSCTSMDYGRTWSKLEPFKSVGLTADSRFHIKRLASGNLILILNNNLSRSNMTVFMSTDNCLTWKYKLVVDTRDNTSYPDATQTSDGTIHMVYDWERYGNKSIYYARFNEDIIKSGNSKKIFISKVNNH
ncbi:MAG: exo-alpha-sialidase [Filimonas sp.]|nr:exo-alpha-sialidase [Filimonas sp.]